MSANAKDQASGTTSGVTVEMLTSVFGLTPEQANAVMLLIPGLVKAEQLVEGQSFQTNSTDAGKKQAAGQQQVPPEMEMIGTFYWSEIAPRLEALGVDPMAFPQIPLGQQMPPQQMQQQQPAQGGQRMPWANSIDARNRTVITDTQNGKSMMLDSVDMAFTMDTVVVKDGVLTAEAVMTAAMVQDYKGKKVLKDPAELKKACDAWRSPMPCTRKHPSEGIVMSQDEIVGWTTPPVWDEKEQKVRTMITVFDQNTIKDIQDGKTDVSIGFFCDLDDTAGKFNDEDYSAVQRNIVFNHLAVALDKGHGRCPDGKCGVQTGDEKDKCEKCGKKGTPDCCEEKKKKDAEMPITEALLTEQKAAAKKLAEKYASFEDPTSEEAQKVASELQDLVWKIKGAQETLRVAKSLDEQKKTTGCDSSKEEPPMTDEKPEPKADEKPEPKPEADNKANPPQGEPQKDEAAKTVEDMIAEERTKLVDAIMDSKPPRERAHYEKKPLADLRDMVEFMTHAKTEPKGVPASATDTMDSKAMIDKAYADMEKRIKNK